METIKTSRAGELKNGFSLLELVVVLSLLAISSLIVLASVDWGLRKLEVRRSALEFAAVARSLRSRAVYRGEYLALVLDPSENSYWLTEGKKIFLSPTVKILTVKGGEVFGEGMRQFQFFPNGRMLGGEVEIAGLDGSSSYLVRLDSISGRIAVLKGGGK